MTARPSSGLQRRDYVELSLWLLTAAAARFAVVYLGDFDGYWGQDPWGYLDQALGLLSDSTHPHLPRIAATEAFWPQGYPAVIAAGIWLGLDPILWGQLSALLAGALTAPALWLAAHHAELSQTTARVAAGLLALCPVHLLWSTCATSDVMAAAWLTLALLCLASPRGGCWSSGWAGVALGAALCTRLAAAPAVLGLALLSWRRGAKATLWTAIAGFVTTAPQLWLWSDTPARMNHPWLQLWRPWNAWRSEFSHVDGLLRFDWPQGVFAWFSPAHPGYLGPIALVLALLGLRALWRERRGLALGLGVWVFGYVLLLSGMPYQNFRFGLIAVAPWALLAGVGVAQWHPKHPRWILATLVFTAALQLTWAGRLIPQHLAVAHGRQKLVAHFTQTLPAKAQVYAFGLTADLAHRSHLDVRELATLSAAALRSQWPPKKMSFVIYDHRNVERQWRPRGGGPVPAIDWLKKVARWYPVERVEGWRLWRIEDRAPAARRPR